MISIGGAVDVMRMVSVESSLQNATEAAVLATASLAAKGDIESLATQYVKSNLPKGKPWDSVEVEVVSSSISVKSRTVEIQASIKLPMIFLRLANINSMNISASSRALQVAKNVEISLVLDISTSMVGEKLTNLKSAAKDFVDEVSDDYTSISLIPFGGTVNIDQLFSTYVTTIAASQVNPSMSSYTRANIQKRAYRFPESGNCIEIRRSDFKDKKIPKNSRPQVPHFWKWRNFNPWCPPSNSAAIFNSNDTGVLTNRIAEFTLSDGTGLDLGALWGLKALSPKWRGLLGGDFADRPDYYYSKNTTKIMILMTDGNITAQFRPRDYSTYNIKRSKNQQTMIREGALRNSAGHNSAVGNLKTVCDFAKSGGVRVFTIGFKIKAGSLGEGLLKYCVANGGSYYHIENLDINAAFKAIRSSISDLRIEG